MSLQEQWYHSVQFFYFYLACLFIPWFTGQPCRATRKPKHMGPRWGLVFMLCRDDQKQVLRQPASQVLSSCILTGICHNQYARNFLPLLYFPVLAQYQILISHRALWLWEREHWHASDYADDSLAGTREKLVMNLCALFSNTLLLVIRSRGFYTDMRTKSGHRQMQLWDIHLKLSQNRTKIAL